MLKWIQQQHNVMIDLLRKWAAINSWSDNPNGLSAMLFALTDSYAHLSAEMQITPLPPHLHLDATGSLIPAPTGHALQLRKHPNAPIQILFGGHMDTVYSPDNEQPVDASEPHILRGPGVADMKGGLIVLLKSLEALESSPYAGTVGWEVLITPDEEIGSTSSASLWQESAKRNHIGLLFEPAFPDGSIVSSRKGSANYTIVSRGRSAHAGRDHSAGRNAISALARFIIAAELLNVPEQGITINVGKIEGGGPVNIVPDFARCRLNVRANILEDMIQIKQKMQDLITSSASAQEGISLSLIEEVQRPPKPLDAMHQRLFNKLQQSTESLGIHLTTTASGGVCDGNLLAAAGLPTIDTLGVIGGHLHTANEYMVLNSLVERTAVTTNFLLQIAEGSIQIKDIR